MQIADKKAVLIHYTLRNSEGEILDSSEGTDPLAYLHGARNIVPGLEKELTGKTNGDKLSVVVEPSEGYGEHNPQGVQQVERSQFPPDAPMEEGMQFMAENPDGSTMPFWITAVDGDTITIDMNHPLAGQQLHFDIEVVEVRDATDEEVQHGHVHGPGGHQH